MEFYSEMNNNYYVAEEIVFIDNIVQAIRYIKHHAFPIDLIQSNEGEVEKLTFVFKKEDTRELYKKWKNYELK